jgi:hypothetical protein
MKQILFFFLAFPLSMAADACNNFIAESELPKAMALEPGAGGKPCGESDPCICFDGIHWEAAEFNEKTKKLKNDPVKLKAKFDRMAAEEAAAKAAEDAEKALFKKVEDGTASAQEEKQAIKALIKSRLK